MPNAAGVIRQLFQSQPTEPPAQLSPMPPDDPGLFLDCDAINKSGKAVAGSAYGSVGHQRGVRDKQDLFDGSGGIPPLHPRAAPRVIVLGEFVRVPTKEVGPGHVLPYFEFG